ncbi:hypothetical protein ACIO8G_36345 [Streptomyces sp. NPDC087219]|uniref:hypothetical protein n=1 Tax=Streptomyces sp. NPDC087219 TaxID=3365770 RepID=UPI0038121F0A
MSMWLTLTKIEPALIEQALEGRGPLVRGSKGDSFACDYRVIDAVAEGRAEVETGAADWTSVYPWLAASVGHGCAAVDEHRLSDASGFVLTPDEVCRVAEGLIAEGWATTSAAVWAASSQDRGLEDLGPFFAAAAAEEKAVLGKVG